MLSLYFLQWYLPLRIYLAFITILVNFFLGSCDEVMRKVLGRKLFFYLWLYHPTLLSLTCLIPLTIVSIPAPAGTSCCLSLLQTFNL